MPSPTDELAAVAAVLGAALTACTVGGTTAAGAGVPVEVRPSWKLGRREDRCDWSVSLPAVVPATGTGTNVCGLCELCGHIFTEWRRTISDLAACVSSKKHKCLHRVGEAGSVLLPIVVDVLRR